VKRIDRKGLGFPSTVCVNLSVTVGLQWQKADALYLTILSLKNLPIKYMMTQIVLVASLLFGDVYFLATRTFWLRFSY
jgi:hypothetical protein